MRPYRITLHCSDSENAKSISVAEITRWHLERGFSGIGYHFVIDVDGDLGKGRAVTELGAHVKGANLGNIGICLVGRDRFTKEQFATLMLLLKRLMKEHQISLKELYCHYQWPSAVAQKKTCPNIPVEVIKLWFQDEDQSLISSYLCI
jgi:N-acetylmuramoyl-L-alanine amidase